MPQKKSKNGGKKKRKKNRPVNMTRQECSGNGKLAAAAAATPVGQVADVPETWRVQQQAERSRLEAVVQSDPDWISFSIGRAHWQPFMVDKDIQAAFSDTRCWQADTKAISMWMTQAENSLIFYVLHRIIERPGRADLFRSLGRGWVFVMLDRPKHRFKWWFESLPLVLHNHPTEILSLGLEGAQLEKYTRGYVVMSEIVFLLKGLTKLKPSDRNVPIISIQKIANDFKYLHKWATNEDVLNAVQAPFPTDEDRIAHTAKTVKREAAKIKRKTSNSSSSSSNNNNGNTASASQLLAARSPRCDQPQNFPSCAMYGSVFETLGFLARNREEGLCVHGSCGMDKQDGQWYLGSTAPRQPGDVHRAGLDGLDGLTAANCRGSQRDKAADEAFSRMLEKFKAQISPGR